MMLLIVTFYVHHRPTKKLNFGQPVAPVEQQLL